VHPNERLQLWCEDEARVGQKGRTCHRWYERGIRPPGLADKRFASLYLFAACRPGTDQAFALALPEATAASMAVFLERFARELEPGAHAALILDRAGFGDFGELRPKLLFRTVESGALDRSAALPHGCRGRAFCRDSPRRLSRHDIPQPL